MSFRKLTGTALIVLAAAFTVYLSAVMIRRIRSVVLKDIYVKVFRYELAVCAMFMLLALDVRFDLLAGPGPVALMAAGRVARIALAAAAAVMLFFAARIAVAGTRRDASTARWAIVLGLALEDGRPTGDLLARMDAAEAYAREVPDAVLILSGGNPDGSGRTEAAVMRELLIGRGVADARMLLEDRSTSTRENFRNAARMIDPGEPVALISSDCHMDRAVRSAKAAGFSRVVRRPAPSSVALYGANVMWEVMMALNELTLKWGSGRSRGARRDPK